MKIRDEWTLLFLADAAVEQNSPSSRVEHERLDGQDQSPPRRVHVVRLEQRKRRFDRAGRYSGKEPGDRELEAVDVDHHVHRVFSCLESHEC